MERTDDDAALIRASLEDPARFAEIFDRHHAILVGYLRRRLEREVAAELASETFAIAFDRRASFDTSRADSRPWLFGIATNLLRHHHRGEVRRLRAYARSGVDPLIDAYEGSEERADAERMRPRLAAALAALSREEADVLLLHTWAELSYSEIADGLGLPIGTVRSRLSRARRRIREQLGDERAIEGVGRIRDDRGR
jgi:RNA polymerase sigma-70 factor (ECF subfamily)